MSRIAKKPVQIPSGVTVEVVGDTIKARGPKGEGVQVLHADVIVSEAEGSLIFAPRDASADSVALVGTMRSLTQNLLTGVSSGYEKKLELVGVGYRAQAQGKMLNLSLGFSHPIEYSVPEGITIETPTQTEVLVKGIDLQKVGQVAAEIRAYRPPEPYKGKGVKYANEQILRKEAKKK
ncbi:50S ribosomal protein L6 [Acidihalobacter ferrooxydans]|uniref:Large ribosomal subunit protein uL6 n=1 Tax=Acidihalobacter ferrooxydans TaxID=1765967 RepID=A0A1P8UJT1_9GAMM|nr:50S ribosomal protein L6 [Acidihalobacter ferrooxydans]APZ44071.1 50S ribosomal protein L6 [Acidihalobacter ferrooxydans]